MPAVASAGGGWEAEPQHDKVLTGLGAGQTRFMASVGVSTRSRPTAFAWAASPGSAENTSLAAPFG